MKANKKITIAHLYPKSMNIYGDRGNVLCLKKRCQWHGIEANIEEVEIGDKYDFTLCDIAFAGGGQDLHQLRIAKDLQKRKSNIFELVEKNKIFLLICGSYQLFGHYFRTREKNEILGISIFADSNIACQITV